MRFAKILVAAAALAAVAAACGDKAPTSPGSDGSNSTGDGKRLVLRISTGGGFVPQEFHLAQVPEFTLTGDGRVFTLGPQIEIFPPPALPPIQVSAVTAAAIGKIRAEAEAAGLGGPDKQYGYDLVADAPTTTFTYVDAAGTTHTISAYALDFESEGDPPPNQTAEDREARAKLKRLRERLLDLRSWLAKDEVGEEKIFEFDALRVYSQPYGTPGAEEPKQEPKDWPLSTPLASFGAVYNGEIRCGVVAGADLDRLLPAVSGSNTRTPWASEGKQYLLVLRPLLPDESGCPKA